MEEGTAGGMLRVPCLLRGARIALDASGCLHRTCRLVGPASPSMPRPVDASRGLHSRRFLRLRHARRLSHCGDVLLKFFIKVGDEASTLWGVAPG